MTTASCLCPTCGNLGYTIKLVPDWTPVGDHGEGFWAEVDHEVECDDPACPLAVAIAEEGDRQLATMGPDVEDFPW